MKFWRSHLYVFFVLMGGVHLFASGVGFHPPQNPPGVVPLFETDYPGLSHFYKDSTLLKSNFSNMRRVVKLDSNSQRFVVRDLLFDKDYSLPVAVDVNYYVKHRLNFQDRQHFTDAVLKGLTQKQTSGSSGIELNIPVKIKSKAFKRIFGGDRVGLRVTGNISFELAGRSESRSGSAVSAYEQRGNFSPRFKQTQQFQVEGRVGDKVSVKVDQNSEATFDFENTLRLTYTGDEDEVVQSIEAGNVSLNLPGTNYVSTTTRHQGLFGLKTQMQLGNLSFIGIASLQRGEKQKITKTGGAQERTFSIRDIDYVKNRFFFVDDIYQENFEKGYDSQNMTWRIFNNGNNQIKRLEVWIKANLADQDTRKGWAVTNPDTFDINNLDNLSEVPGEIETAYFKKLEYPKDYGYDEYRGFFWLNQNMNDQDIVAVAYQLADGTTKGMLVGDISDTTSILLKLIKPKALKPEYPTWKLSMRNVYNLGAAQIPSDGFDVQVLYTKTGENVDVQPVAPQLPFIYLMGLDRLDEQGNFIEGGDKKIDVKNGNLFDLANGYLIFPSTTPFFPPEGSDFAIDKSLDVNIYDSNDPQQDLREHKFDIEVTTSSTSSTFNLGFNVLEGSEVVKLNGRVLERDKEYTIDYFSGTLQLLDQEARRADANVEIEYERGALFQLDKKTLLGGRMEYSFGDRGFIGMTGLYLNKTTLDQRVRLGQEPVRNFIWDLNGAFDFRPNFITKALDKLPIVETSAESRLHVEAEYAQVNPNPNTFNEDKLGEKNGVAYIDDFEGSKRSTTLGITYRTWSPASIPARFRIPRLGIDEKIPLTADSTMYEMDRDRVHLFWYNPYDQVPINDIWPNRDVNSQTGYTTNVLDLQWKNDDIPQDKAWGGIMRSTISFPDQQKTKYIEMWIQGDIGQVNVDIGRISEDYYIRDNTFTYDGKRSLRNLNTEDRNLNGLLDDGEDVGLDGVPDGNPNDDPSDDWRQPLDTQPNFLQINGTEGNGDVKGAARYPDTEDLDGDGGLNLTNEYFSYSFDLSDIENKYIQGKTDPSSGKDTSAVPWRLYRIPIRNYNPDFMVGKPDTNFREIFFVRFWVNDLPKDGLAHRIRIASFDFVGNEWEENGIAEKGSSTFERSDSLFTITVYNTEENVVAIEGGPEPYHSPPDVTGVRDRITKALSKEQSLVMQMTRLRPGERAEATKQLVEKMNLINYKKLKMFVHGDRKLPVQDSPLEFYMRFGPTEGIYYEVGGPVYPHWDDRNDMEIILDDLAKTKQPQFRQADSLNGQPIYYRQDPDHPEKYFKVVGEPNLRNINFITIGARNAGEFNLDDMEIWLDELRVTDVEREKGVAMRLSTDLTMADVGNVRAQWEVVDGDFRRIEDQFGTGMTTENQNYRFGLKLNKFFPDSWGLQIPISGGLLKSRQVPKYFYNSDQLTKYRVNGFGNKLKQLFGFSPLDPVLEENSRISESRSLGATIQRRGTGKNPWYLKYSVDMFTLDFDWSKKHGSDERTLMNDAQSISSSLQMAVPFGRENFFQPFGWLGNGPIVRALSGQKMYYTPSSLQAGITVRDNESIRRARLEQQATKTVTTTASRSMSVGYMLFPSLSFNFSREYQSDAQLKGYRINDLVNAIIKRFDFGIDKTMNQNFGGNYNPRFFGWLTQSFKYTSTFNYNFNNIKTNDRSSRLQVMKQATVSLKPSMLANQIYNPLRKKVEQNKPTPPGRGNRRIPGLRPGEGDNPNNQNHGNPPQGADQNLGGSRPENLQENGQAQDSLSKGENNQDQDKDKQQKRKPKRPPIKIPNPAILVYKFFNAWQSVSLDYRVQDNYQYYNIAGLPGWKHQLGFQTGTGVGTDTTFGKLVRLPSFRNSKNLNAGLDFDIMKNLNSSFKYNYTKDNTVNNQQHTEALSSSYFFMGEDPDANKKSWNTLIPDWQFRLTGVENILFFKKFAKTVSLDHARSGKYTESSRYNEDTKEKDSWSYTNSYSPFLGITINTIWGVSGTIRYTKSTSYNYSAAGAAKKSYRSGFDVNFTYSKTGGFNLPLPFLKNKKLNNEMQFSLNFNSTSDLSYAKRPQFDKFEEERKNNSWKLKPSVSYRFSQKVNGSMFIEKSVSTTKLTGTYSYFEFGINVNIAIR